MSNFTYGNKVGRAAAILTTGEVAGASLTLDTVWGGFVTTQLDFTLGSLTNITVRMYGSMDGTNWYQITNDSGVLIAPTVTANSTNSYCCFCAGWKFFRASVQGSGTVTSSSATLTYRFLKVGSQ